MDAALSRLQDRLAGPLRGLIRRDGPVAVAAAPGCLDLLGGLGATFGSTLLQMPLPVSAAVAVQPRDDALLVLHSEQITPPLGEPDCELSLAPLLEMPRSRVHRELLIQLSSGRSWAASLAALAVLLAETTGRVRGANVVIHSDVPLHAGQGASRALLAAALVAWEQALGLTQPRATQVAQITQAHAKLSPHTPPCADVPAMLEPRAAGRVVRYAAARNVMEGLLPLPESARIVALNTGVRVAAATGRAETLLLAGVIGRKIIETVYADLGRPGTPGQLANLSPSLYARYFRGLLPRKMRGADFVRTYGSVPASNGAVEPDRLYRVRAAVDHLLAEHEYADAFWQLLEELTLRPRKAALPAARVERKLRRAGRLLLASHHSARLRVELSCREADWIVDTLRQWGPERGVYGARITGRGGGGTVVALLARTPEADAALAQLATAYSQIAGLELGIREIGNAGNG